MISRGKHRGIHLYELTSADLLDPNIEASRYTPGNVLLFASKKDVELGNELACAQDLGAAHEFLDNTLANTQRSSNTAPVASAGTREPNAKSNAKPSVEPGGEPGVKPGAESGVESGVLRTRLAQRDELLKELAENLDSQRETNALLAAQLELAKTKLAIDDASREELIDDLQRVSAETSNIETTLERTMGEKCALEQELASSITELLEVNLRCDDLQKRIALEGIMPDSINTHAKTALEPALDHASEPASEPGEQTFTTASGKQIHIFHEFGSDCKRTGKHSATFRTVRLTIIAIVILAAIGIGSILTTAQLNSATPVEALALLLDFIPFW